MDRKTVTDNSTTLILWHRSFMNDLNINNQNLTITGKIHYARLAIFFKNTAIECADSFSIGKDTFKFYEGGIPEGMYNIRVIDEDIYFDTNFQVYGEDYLYNATCFFRVNSDYDFEYVDDGCIYKIFEPWGCNYYIDDESKITKTNIKV